MIPLLCRRSASVRLENDGNRRENGTDRTSTIAVTPCAFSNAKNWSAGRLEWPMVKRLVSREPVIGNRRCNESTLVVGIKAALTQRLYKTGLMRRSCGSDTLMHFMAGEL